MAKLLQIAQPSIVRLEHGGDVQLTATARIAQALAIDFRRGFGAEQTPQVVVYLWILGGCVLFEGHFFPKRIEYRPL